MLINKSLTPEISPWDYLSDSGRLPKMPYFYRIIILKNKRQMFYLIIEVFHFKTCNNILKKLFFKYILEA